MIRIAGTTRSAGGCLQQLNMIVDRSSIFKRRKHSCIAAYIFNKLTEFTIDTAALCQRVG